MTKSYIEKGMNRGGLTRSRCRCCISQERNVNDRPAAESNERMRDLHCGETKSKERVERDEGIQKTRNKEKESQACGLRARSISQVSRRESDRASVR